MRALSLISHCDKARAGWLAMARLGQGMDSGKMKSRCGWMIVILLAAVPLCWSQEQRKDTPAPGVTREPVAGVNLSPGFDERNPRYQLCPGDVLDLHFEFTPEFNQSNVAVQPDGFAALTGVGDLHVAGLTVPELTKTLESTYGKILAKPVITVLLRDFNKPYFIATGQVSKPGKYDLRANTTLIEAIGIAGGLNDTSKHSEVWIFHRQSDGNVQSRRVNVKQMLASGNINEDVRLQPGDTIFIPQNTASKIKGFIQPSLGATVIPSKP
jgi:polysaccharide export outer membrane protein